MDHFGHQYRPLGQWYQLKSLVALPYQLPTTELPKGPGRMASEAPTQKKELQGRARHVQGTADQMQPPAREERQWDHVNTFMRMENQNNMK